MFEPRRQQSFRHTPQNLPPDLALIIKESLYQKYTYFNDKTLLVQGSIYPEEIILLIGFKEKGSLRQWNFECSMDYENTENSKVLEKFHSGADALDGMIHEYIDAKGDIEMPKSWMEIDFEKEKIYLRFSTLNTEIEKMTLEFLKEKGEDLSSLERPPQLH